MPFDSSEHAVILPARSADHGRLLDWILSGRQQAASESQTAASIIDRARQEEVSLAGLFQASLAGQLVGTAWGQLLPGKLGVVWPLRLADAASHDDGIRLLAAVDDFLDDQQASVHISLPGTDSTPAEEQQRQLLLASAYQMHTELISMSLLLAGSQPIQASSLQLHAAADDKQLIDELQATEEASLDIPELQGCRSPVDVLATYRSEAADEDLGWFIAQHQDSPVGCLLLARDPVGNSCTIQYMGLRPEVRGQGWGADLLGLSINWARQRGTDNVRLMVDRRNQPARQLYLRGGMIEFERRELWTR
jgi:GNAT superfamily N-acetyltransferase